MEHSVTFKVILPHGTSEVSIRPYLHGWFHLLKQGDPHSVLLSRDGKHSFLQARDIPRSKDSLEEFFTPEISPLRGGNRKQLKMYLKLTSSFLLKQHYTQNKPYKDFVYSHNIWFDVNGFQSTPTSVIGFLAEVHPRLTHLNSLRDNITQSLDSTLPTAEESNAYSSAYDGSAPAGTPRLSLFRSSKHMIVDEKRTKTEVISIRCATKDRQYLTHLLSRASEEGKLPAGFFVPSDNNSPANSTNILKGHTQHISTLKCIPILGLSWEAATTPVPDNQGQHHPFLNVISLLSGASSIQPTDRTPDLGKWLIVVPQSCYDGAVSFVDNDLPQIFSECIPNKDKLRQFEHPRRPSRTIPSTTIGKYADTLRTYADASSSIPITHLNNPARKKTSPPISIVTTQEDFPPLPKKKQRTNGTQSSTSSHPTSISPITPDESLQRSLREMEERTEQRI